MCVCVCMCGGVGVVSVLGGGGVDGLVGGWMDGGGGGVDIYIISNGSIHTLISASKQCFYQIPIMK